jgi:hypothetical protein
MAKQIFVGDAKVQAVAAIFLKCQFHLNAPNLTFMRGRFQNFVGLT